MSTRGDFTDTEWAMLEALPWVAGISLGRGNHRRAL